MNSKIFKEKNALTYNEKFLLDKINEYPHKFLNLNIVDFASEFFSTKSTLSRLIKKLGFESVLDMKLYCQRELTKSGLYQLEIDSDLPSRLNNLKTYNNYAITNTIENLDLKSFSQVCKRISLASKILVFGIRSSFLACYELATNLQKLGKNANAYDEIHETILKIASFNSHDLIIIFSKNANNKEVLFLLEKAKEMGIDSILITANESISENITYKILLKNMVKDKRIIATCSKTSQIVLADAILHEIYFMNKNNDQIINSAQKLMNDWREYIIKK